ncbi:MAG: hypothetical protein L0H00_05950, partial [Micrococcales bacterium]|nr:hypothetical protein [Micrococcales bacterium]
MISHEAGRAWNPGAAGLVVQWRRGVLSQIEWGEVTLRGHSMRRGGSVEAQVVLGLQDAGGD